MCAKIISAVKSCVGEELSAVDLELKNSRRIRSVKSCVYVCGLTTLRGQEPPTVPEAGQIPEHPPPSAHDQETKGPLVQVLHEAILPLDFVEGIGPSQRTESAPGACSHSPSKTPMAIVVWKRCLIEFLTASKSDARIEAPRCLYPYSTAMLTIFRTLELISPYVPTASPWKSLWLKMLSSGALPTLLDTEVFPIFLAHLVPGTPSRSASACVGQQLLLWNRPPGCVMLVGTSCCLRVYGFLTPTTC